MHAYKVAQASERSFSNYIQAKEKSIVTPMSRPILVKVTTYGRKILWVFGLYHGKRLEKHFLYGLSRAITLAIYFLFPALILAQLFLHGFDFTAFLSASTYLFAGLWVCVKILLQIYNLQKLLDIEEQLETDILNAYTKEQEHFIWLIEAAEKIVLRGCYTLCFCIISAFMLCPIITDYSVVVPIWIPFADEASDVITYIYESLYFVAVSITYSAMETAIVGCIFMVTAQFKILKENLQRACERDADESYAEQERKIQGRLRWCVIHHNAIL
ncbi:hypothetical protein Trydic_g19321, partial [Trypoxylus dichotomus]